MDDPFPPDLRVEREALALIAAGQEVTIVTFRGDVSAAHVSDYKGVEVVTLPLSRFWVKMSALAYTFPSYHRHLARRLNRVWSERPIDVLHIHDLRVARAALDSRPAGSKVVLDLHENRPEIMRLYKHVQAFPGRWLIYPDKWAEYEQRYIQQADVAIVVTQEAVNWYSERNVAPRREFCVVPNYAGQHFNPNPRVKTLDGGPIRMVYIGDTGERRGLGIALEAIRDLKGRCDVRLDVLGDSTFQPRIAAMVEEWGLQDQVHLHGWVDPSAFDGYLSQGQVGICPIQRNPHHDTTYANKIFQYMAYGMPILVSDCPAQVAVVEEHSCGAVHEAASPQEFSRALLELVEDASRFEGMSEAGLEATRTRRNWEAAAEDLVRCYSSLGH